jgi:hypothetical protein
VQALRVIPSMQTSGRRVSRASWLVVSRYRSMAVDQGRYGCCTFLLQRSAIEHVLVAFRAPASGVVVQDLVDQDEGVLGSAAYAPWLALVISAA